MHGVFQAVLGLLQRGMARASPRQISIHYRQQDHLPAQRGSQIEETVESEDQHEGEEQQHNQQRAPIGIVEPLLRVTDGGLGQKEAAEQRYGKRGQYQGHVIAQQVEQKIAVMIWFQRGQ